MMPSMRRHENWIWSISQEDAIDIPRNSAFLYQRRYYLMHQILLHWRVITSEREIISIVNFHHPVEEPLNWHQCNHQAHLVDRIYARDANQHQPSIQAEILESVVAIESLGSSKAN